MVKKANLILMLFMTVNVVGIAHASEGIVSDRKAGTELSTTPALNQNTFIVMNPNGSSATYIGGIKIAESTSTKLVDLSKLKPKKVPFPPAGGKPTIPDIDPITCVDSPTCTPSLPVIPVQPPKSICIVAICYKPYYKDDRLVILESEKVLPFPAQLDLSKFQQEFDKINLGTPPAP